MSTIRLHPISAGNAPAPWQDKPGQCVITVTMSAAEILASVKRVIREPYAWPGGHPCYVVMQDGGALDAQSAKENWASIVASTLTGARDGWAAAGTDINWEDGDLVCDHSGRQIECAYPADEAEG